jgi:hypothetical protein
MNKPKQYGYHMEVCPIPECGRLVPVSNTIKVDTRKGFHIKSKPNTLKSMLRTAWWYFSHM